MNEAAIAWAVQGSIVLGVGLLVALMLRSRAAVGHCALVAAVAMALAIPAASWIAGRAGVGLLPARGIANGEPPPVQLPAAPGRLSAAAASTETPTAVAGTPAGTGSAAAIVARSPNRPWMTWSRVLGAAGILWGVMSALVILRALTGVGRAIAIRRGSRATSDPLIAAAIERGVESLGISRAVELRESDAVSCPVICCWGRAAMVIPTGQPRRGIDWDAVAAHELAHLKRRDYFWALAAEAVVCAMPWNPLAWMARRRVHALAERACDQWALGRARSAAAYADSLLAFVPRARLAMAPAIVSGSGLAGRVRSILAEQRVKARAGRGVIATAVVVAVAGVGLTALARARQPEKKPEQPSEKAAVPDPPNRANREDRPERAPIATGDVEAELKELVELWQATGGRDTNSKLWDLARDLSETGDARIIPVMIGVIDADNSYNTVYGVGYFGLSKITGVKHSPFHDGAWWRRWWETNKAKFPAVKDAAIPEYPKTRHGQGYTPFPADLDTYDGLIRKLVEDYAKSRPTELELSNISRQLAELKDPRAIPIMIGVIDADNSYGTVYGVGYFGLGWLTQVRYSPYHDGAWWRRWWDANKAKYPDAVGIPIPTLAKTEHGKAYTPMPESFETLDGKVAWLREALAAGKPVEWMQIAEAMASHDDARAIPVMIGIIEAERQDTIYTVGYFGLSKLTKVTYVKTQDGAWWRAWWDENKGKFPQEARDMAIPDWGDLVAQWKRGAADRQRAALDAEFAGFPAEKVSIDGNFRKMYFLLGPGAAAKEPAAGWKLLLILPGGDGGEAFHAYCRNIQKSALPEGYIAAELVAPVWKNHENRTVWPTSTMNPDGGEFTTEEFIKAVVADVSKRLKVDPSRVYALGWSSSGPALYCDSLQESPIKGYFIAMSVFRPNWMGDIAGAKGKPYFILHSPDDKMIPIAAHARKAETELKAAGAVVEVVEYAGGHGWTEDPFGHIRRGVEWFELKR